MRWRRTFQARIVGVLALLLLVLIGAVYFAVKTATTQAVEKQAQQQLKIGTRVFERLLDLRGRTLQYGVDWLVLDSEFRRAVLSGKPVDILAALAQHRGGIRSSEMFVLSPDGRVIASTLPAVARDRPFLYDQALRRAWRHDTHMLFVAIQGRPYLLVQGQVQASSPLARVVMGFPMDELFARELRSMSNLEVSFLTVDAQRPGELFSTQPEFFWSPIINALGDPLWQSLPPLSDAHGQRFLNQALQLANTGDPADPRVMVLLQSPLEQALQAFAPLDREFLWIALVALVVSLVCALLMARRVSRPLEDLAEAARRIGAGNYQAAVAIKRSDEFGVLADAFNAMQSAIATRERQLAHNALHDPLTGLPNRALAIERLGQAIAARRKVVLLYLGIDNHRAIHEGFGSEGLEQMMGELSRRLPEVLTQGDTAARITASEFLLLLENTELDGAIAVADRLHELLSQPQRIHGDEVRRQICMGMAVYPADGQCAEELISRAAIARHDASLNPGYLQVYQQDRDLAHQRQISLIRDLRRAAAEDELFLLYQPKLDRQRDDRHQAEALLRWQHPVFGVVSPAEFIPLAERTGSMHSLTSWVIEACIGQLAEWNRRALPVRLSLNISASDLEDDGLEVRVSECLERYQVAAEQLVFEITESAIMRNPQQALAVLQRLRGCGISLSVDDFGTGYSSLAQLQRLPVQELKIDQSFIRNLNETSGDAVIVRSTIEMSHKLGLKVVAEGVEFEHCLRLLESWGCDTLQGYLISRPLVTEAFERWALRSRVPS
ncbi:EAL domain-containing protein [Pseudomonas protegens]|uniref:EAL domain-containing protein n=1 Tax=Pseudomonas protegens TaxID=380021 RepID=A0A7G8YJR9_9PSED|nr:GGDEF domain-containing phosphodiesterase [Pseudomonas protegens]QNH75919.1 EAL domain-containing protein [Pseudomonas protegens]QNL05113.1 EAL domain-containing protein [Pseudomonas protegens]